MLMKAGLSLGTGFKSEGLLNPSCDSKIGVVTFVLVFSILSPRLGKVPA